MDGTKCLTLLRIRAQGKYTHQSLGTETPNQIFCLRPCMQTAFSVNFITLQQ